ncbi:MAG: restriction endonuclease subunit S, partial [Bacteroidia bacterium]|nr:restriction endonuclease subunit S [Bacteroidia bacterium]
MQSTKPQGESFTYIDIDAVNNNKNIIDKPKKILCTQAPSRATRKVEEDNILFSMVRPYLKNIALVSQEHKEAIASTGFYVIRPFSVLFSKYIFRLLLSPYVVDGLNQYMKGDNSPSINNEHIESYLYPIPPINEQYRIVAQIQEILPLVERYNSSQAIQDKLNSEIKDKLRKSILQEAIQGRLVPQIESEGTAAELLEQIKVEKQKLVKEG